MRISDWSSDVCSSDLPGGDLLQELRQGIDGDTVLAGDLAQREQAFLDLLQAAAVELHRARRRLQLVHGVLRLDHGAFRRGACRVEPPAGPVGDQTGRASCRERVWPYV